MSPRRDEWAQLIAAGERDCIAFHILDRDPEAPDEIVLFHAQQAAEKFLKAALAAKGIVYRRTHDLLELVEICAANRLEVPADRDAMVRLGPYAVEFRYLGAVAPEVTRSEAQTVIESLRSWANGQYAAANE
jgi:HEPN domain-containing protein